MFFALLVNNLIHRDVFVNRKIHRTGRSVDYRKATDRLFERITAADLAEKIGVSQNAVARARLDPSTRDYRPPPAGWQAAVSELAAERAEELLALKREMEESGTAQQ